MSLKAELETWAAALKAFEEEDFEKSLDLFSRIADSSKILTNMGLIYATLGEHEAAVERFREATELDQYLAVAYFQCGVSHFLLGRYELALKDFDEASLYLRGNRAINYEQLGLKFLLYSAEVLFNKGLAEIYLGRVQEGLAVLEDALRDKATDEHNVIDDAIQDRGEGYTVFSIPIGVLYRPSENKLRNAKAKDYMGKAKLVAASDSMDAFTTFSGVTRLQQGISPAGVYVETPTLETSGSPVVGLGRSGTLPLDRSMSDSLSARTNIRVATNNLTDATSPASAPISRSNTTLNVAKPSANATIGGPVRGLSVRRPVGPEPRSAGPLTAPVDKEPPPLPTPGKERGPRVTEIYDNYLNSYTEEPSPPLPGGQSPDRVAAWARSNANPNNRPTRNPTTRSAPASQYAPSSFGGSSSARRKTTRKQARNMAQVSMYEEEEGYVSGEYDEGPFELVKIRVKLHYQDEVRGMAITPEMSFEEFLDRITSKFGKGLDSLEMKFKDEDGSMISLRDDSDYELAIETARESAKGKPEGKLEIWCVELDV